SFQSRGSSNQFRQVEPDRLVVAGSCPVVEIVGLAVTDVGDQLLNARGFIGRLLLGVRLVEVQDFLRLVTGAAAVRDLGVLPAFRLFRVLQVGRLFVPAPR